MRSNILIIADMEGCPGITDMRQYDDCREKMIEETERVIQAVENCSNACITVADCHNYGKNIVEYFSGKGYVCCEHIWSIKNVEKYDCAMLIGFHPKKGEDGFCPHTLRPDVDELFLGEKSIGEVELLINWLAGYGVPVVFVSGDSAVKKELNGYNCVFYAADRTGEKVSDRHALLEHMLSSIKMALDLPGNKEVCYNDSVIKVKLERENCYKWLPGEIFSIENGMVVFPDTEKFISSLLPFCEFLNLAEGYQRLRLKHLGKKIRENYACVEKDSRGNQLLKEKEWRALSDDEIGYLYRLLK